SNRDTIWGAAGIRCGVVCSHDLRVGALQRHAGHVHRGCRHCCWEKDDNNRQRSSNRRDCGPEKAHDYLSALRTTAATVETSVREPGTMRMSEWCMSPLDLLKVSPSPP